MGGPRTALLGAAVAGGVLLAAPPAGVAAPRANPPALRCPPAVFVCAPWSAAAPAPPRPVPSRTVAHGPLQAPAARAGAAAFPRPPAPRWSPAPTHPAVPPQLGAPYLVPTEAVAQPGIAAQTNGYLLTALLMLVGGAALILLARGIHPGRPPALRRPSRTSG